MNAETPQPTSDITVPRADHNSVTSSATCDYSDRGCWLDEFVKEESEALQINPSREQSGAAPTTVVEDSDNVDESSDSGCWLDKFVDPDSLAATPVLTADASPDTSSVESVTDASLLEPLANEADVISSLVDKTHLDIDCVQVEANTKILGWMSRNTFAVGHHRREFEKNSKLLLVAVNPGFVYVQPQFKDSIIAGIFTHFSVTFLPSHDQVVLLRSQERRLTATDLSVILMNAGVSRVFYVNFGMKASLYTYAWLATTPPEYQARVIIDVGTTHVAIGAEGEDVFELYHGTPSFAPGYNVESFPLFAALQKDSVPTYGTFLIRRTRLDVGPIILAKVYNTWHHHVLASSRAGWDSETTYRKAIRLHGQYMSALLPLAERMTAEDMKTCVEIRSEVNDMTQVPDLFDAFRDQVLTTARCVTIPFREWKAFVPAAFDWARSSRTFYGRNSSPLSLPQLLRFNVVLNAFGRMTSKIRFRLAQAEFERRNCYNYFRHVIASASGVEPTNLWTFDHPYLRVTKDNDDAIDVAARSGEDDDVDMGHGDVSDYDRNNGDDGNIDKEAKGDHGPIPTDSMIADDIRRHLVIQPFRGRFCLRKVTGKFDEQGYSEEDLVKLVQQERGADWRGVYASKD